jgi:hypothetical protein
MRTGTNSPCDSDVAGLVVAEWVAELAGRRSAILDEPVTAIGRYTKYAGNPQDAEVGVALEPTSAFCLENALPSETKAAMHDLYFESAVFGIMDVLLCQPYPPLRNVRVRIVGAEVGPDSPQVAFRMAGRIAALRLLATAKLSSVYTTGDLSFWAARDAPESRSD